MAYRHTMAQKSESRDLDKVIVRLPDGMRDRIKHAAEANNRSMNAEIVATLEEKYPPVADIDKFFSNLGKKFQNMSKREREEFLDLFRADMHLNNDDGFSQMLLETLESIHRFSSR